MTTKARLSPKDPNYTRFYEFDTRAAKICCGCPALNGMMSWSTILFRIRGVPVHTNWPADKASSISTVYICESPSDKEFSQGFPTVGKTGQRIYKDEKPAGNIEDGWLDYLDQHFYRTNLVRCQADSGLQGRVDDEKNLRVDEAAHYCFRHLEAELRLIAKKQKGTKVRFVIGVGKGFREWGQRAEKLASSVCKEEGVIAVIEIGSHPSARRR